MKHINIISLVSLTLLSACGSQADSGTEHTASVNSSLPAAQQGTSATIAAAEVADTLHGAQQGSSADAPSAPVATPEPSPVASPAPVASDVPVPVVTPVPTPSVTPSPAPSATPTSTVCHQVNTDYSYNYNCGLWLLTPSAGGICAAHTAEYGLIPDGNGGYKNGTLDPDTGNVTFGVAPNVVTLFSRGGNGSYTVQSVATPGRPSVSIDCPLIVSPAQ